MGYYLSTQMEEAIIYILPFTAGGFIYIAASDLVPELHKEATPRKSLTSFGFFLLGFMFMLFAKLFFPH